MRALSTSYEYMQFNVASRTASDESRLFVAYVVNHIIECLGISMSFIILNSVQAFIFVNFKVVFIKVLAYI